MARTPQRNYTVEALTHQYHLIFLLFLACLAALTWSWLPVVGAVGFEMIYLAAVPGSKRFQRAVEKKYRALAHEDERSEFRARIAKLPHDQAMHVELVRDLIDSIRDNLTSDEYGLLSGVESRLKPFLERYISLLEVLNSYRTLMSTVDVNKLRRDISEVDGQIESASSERVRKTLRDRRDVLERRLERLQLVRDNESIIGHQLATIEDTLKLIRESTITVRNPDGVSSQLDELLSEVEIAEQAVLDAESITSSSQSRSEQELEAFEEELAEVESR